MSTGDYTATLQIQGGARLWLDDQLVVDRWDGPDETDTAVTHVVDGYRQIYVEYRALGGPASLHLIWQEPIILRDHFVYLPPLYETP